MATPVRNEDFTRLASKDQLNTTVQALRARGITTVVVETGEEARRKVLDLIPDEAEVYNSPSHTLESIGLETDVLLMNDMVLQLPNKGVKDLATAEVLGQLHETVKTSSRTRWSRIRSGGEPSKK